ncbi:histidine phosphatase family protein [Shouchella miscanthi]|uniref:Histidine phosphatase family protein n=1 Tax=Shouchella miscanthi TaxID=2598861 RepID=A0ABU6NPW3_9BACI|nr:histidine phosphatase family protein [Shouchella miscanthi]
MKLYFIRHGESEGNKQGKIQGTMDFPLSDLGERQADAVAEFTKSLSIDQIYTSDLTRALHTAQAITKKHNQSLKETTLLREVHLGSIQGKTREDIYTLYPHLKGKPLVGADIEGSETTDDLSERCEQLFALLKEKHANDESVLLVSHGGFISMVLTYLIVGKQWGEASRPFVIGNTSVSLVEWDLESNRFYIDYTNRTAHLEAVKADYQARKGIL